MEVKKMKQISTEELIKMTACEICDYAGYDKFDEFYYAILQILNDCIGYTLDLGVICEENYNECDEDVE